MSLRQESECVSMHKLTILDHLSQDHGLDRDRLPNLSKEKELQLLEKIQVVAYWGFPLTGRDLCHFVKSYPDKGNMVS